MFIVCFNEIQKKKEGRKKGEKKGNVGDIYINSEMSQRKKGRMVILKTHFEYLYLNKGGCDFYENKIFQK